MGMGLPWLTYHRVRRTKNCPKDNIHVKGKQMTPLSEARPCTSLQDKVSEIQ
jgi:hypothetical protein